MRRRVDPLDLKLRRTRQARMGPMLCENPGHWQLPASTRAFAAGAHRDGIREASR